MSSRTQPDLPRDVDFEEPPPQAPKRGLVPRSILPVVLVIFLLLLTAMAAWDLFLRPPKVATDQSTGKGDAASPAARKAELPPAPPEADIDAIINAQRAKSAPSAPLGTPSSVALPTAAPAPAGGPLGAQAPLAGRGPVGVPAALDPDAARIEREEAGAVSGLSALDGSASRSAAPSPSPTNFLAEEMRRLAGESSGSRPQLPADILKAVSGQTIGAAPLTPTSRDAAFLREASERRPSETASVQKPAGQWVLHEGTPIPVVTLNAINTDLPGEVRAKSTDPVFDSIHGCALMVPPGTTFLGRYSPDIRPGQSRVLMAFRRMILPNGDSVDLTGAQGMDSQGRSGVPGEVNNHFAHMFGYGLVIALLSTKVGNSGANVVNQSNGTTTSGSVAGQVLSDVSGRILNRNAVIPPTITVEPAGARLFISLTRDVVLDPVGGRCR